MVHAECSSDRNIIPNGKPNFAICIVLRFDQHVYKQWERTRQVEIRSRVFYYQKKQTRRSTAENWPLVTIDGIFCEPCQGRDRIEMRLLNARTQTA